MAAESQHQAAELARFLFDHGFAPDDVNGADAGGFTPLMRAAYRGLPMVVRTLIRIGARIDTRNGDGNQPLWFACVSDDPEVIDLVIAAGGDVDHVNRAGATAMMYAASAGKAHAVRALLIAGVDLNVEMGGLTALDMAATPECLLLLRAADRAARSDPEREGKGKGEPNSGGSREDHRA